MPKKNCPNCGKLVQMKHTVQSGREWCPKCRVVPEDWDRNEPPVPSSY